MRAWIWIGLCASGADLPLTNIHVPIPIIPILEQQQAPLPTILTYFWGDGLRAKTFIPFQPVCPRVRAQKQVLHHSFLACPLPPVLVRPGPVFLHPLTPNIPLFHARGTESGLWRRIDPNGGRNKTKILVLLFLWSNGMLF